MPTGRLRRILTVGLGASDRSFVEESLQGVPGVTLLRHLDGWSYVPREIGNALSADFVLLELRSDEPAIEEAIRFLENGMPAPPRVLVCSRSGSPTEVFDADAAGASAFFVWPDAIALQQSSREALARFFRDL